MDEEVANIRERLEKVSVLVPRKYSVVVGQILNDCKYLLLLVEKLSKEKE